MNSVMLQSMHDELLKIAAEKDSGFLEDAKKVLTTPIAGTQPWLLGREGALGKSVSSTGGAVKKVTSEATKRTANGAYDVSRMAKDMGIT